MSVNWQNFLVFIRDTEPKFVAILTFTFWHKMCNVSSSSLSPNSTSSLDGCCETAALLPLFHPYSMNTTLKSVAILIKCQILITELVTWTNLVLLAIVGKLIIRHIQAHTCILLQGGRQTDKTAHWSRDVIVMVPHGSKWLKDAVASTYQIEW